jgi:hypothetical protein
MVQLKNIHKEIPLNKKQATSIPIRIGISK